MDFVDTLAAVATGAALGFLGSYAVSRIERADAERDQLRRALASFRADICAAVARLRELPPAREPGPLQRGIDRARGPQQTWVATQRALLRTLGPAWRLSAERVVYSGAQVKLFKLPLGLREAIEASENYIIRLGKSRDDEVLAQWPSVHTRLERECENALRPPRRWRLPRRPRTGTAR